MSLDALALLTANPTELRIPVDPDFDPRELVITRWMHRERGLMLRFSVVRAGTLIPPLGEVGDEDPHEEFDVPAGEPTLEALSLLLNVSRTRAQGAT